jgi:putative membrane protein insertion efficiency factor
MKTIAIACIRLYQKTLSPDHGPFRNQIGPVCRFTPTCSEYTIDAIQIHGIMSGGWLGIKRICRCHPFNPGGHDPVPLSRSKAEGLLRDATKSKILASETTSRNFSSLKSSK